MDQLRRIQSKSALSRLAGFDLPIVESPEDARRVAQAVSSYLAAATPAEQALLFSDLALLEKSLARRLQRLQQDIDAVAGELRLLNSARGAQHAYQRARTAPGRKGRPRCP